MPNPSEGPQTGESPAKIRKAGADKRDSGTGADTTHHRARRPCPSLRMKNRMKNRTKGPCHTYPPPPKSSVWPRDVSLRPLYCEPKVLGGEPDEDDWERWCSDVSAVKEQDNGVNIPRCDPGPGGKCLQARMKHHLPCVFERISGRREVMESDGILDASIDFMDKETSEEED